MYRQTTAVAFVVAVVLSGLTPAQANFSGGFSQSNPNEDMSGRGRQVLGVGVLRGVNDEDSSTSAFDCSAVSVGDATSTTIVNAESTEVAPDGYTGCWVEQHQIVGFDPVTSLPIREWIPVGDAPGRSVFGNASTTADTQELGLDGPLRVCWEVVSTYTDGYVARTSGCGNPLSPGSL